MAGVAERRARTSGDEVAAARIAFGAIALHVLDGAFVDRQSGTAAADHLVSGLVGVAILACLATHRARSAVRAADLGRPYEYVSLRTSDGLALRGWYVPSRNGAAVIAVPGREDPVAHPSDARLPRLRRAGVPSPRRRRERRRLQRVRLKRRARCRGGGHVPRRPARRRRAADRRHRPVGRRRDAPAGCPRTIGGCGEDRNPVYFAAARAKTALGDPRGEPHGRAARPPARVRAPRRGVLRSLGARTAQLFLSWPRIAPAGYFFVCTLA